MKHAIIPLFIPHYGCPHQCIFCNQIRITGHTTPVTAREAAETIERYRGRAAETAIGKPHSTEALLRRFRCR